MISVICAYNDRLVLDEYLIKSLNTQQAAYEPILLDNTDRTFSAAARALNTGGLLAHGKYLMFVHQDVRLCSPDWLGTAEQTLDQVADVGIAGVAGMSEDGRNNQERRRNIILEHEDPVRTWGNAITQPEVVQTVDECLTIVPKDVFEVMKFDEKTCDGWHHYAVDYSLTARVQGLAVIVLPLLVHHRSLGFSRKLTLKMNSIGEIQRYYRSLGRLVAKHKALYEWIYTTNGDYCTSRSALYQDLRRLPEIIPQQFLRGKSGR